MKPLLILLAFFAAKANAQDVIVKKDGSTILSKVLEVNLSDVKYKKYSNQNGPTYTISKNDILSINYENGEKETFENNNSQQSSQPTQNPSSPRLIQSSPSENNNNLINKYGKRYTIAKKYHPKKATVNSGLTTWGVAPSSIISNQDIELEFEDKWNEDYNKYFHYIIIVKNRTNRTIYIDRGNSYRVTSNENYCYYNSGTGVTTSSGSGVGLSSNLGGLASAVGIGGILGSIAQGINVGGGLSNSSGMSVGQQRFLVLPPNGKAALAQEKEIKGYKLENDEKLVNRLSDLKFPIHKGETLNFDENNTPFTIDYLITYSYDQNFTTYSILNTRLYMKQIFGTHLSGWSTPINGTFRGSVNRRISDIDQNCIIGYIGDTFITDYVQKH